MKYFNDQMLNFISEKFKEHSVSDLTDLFNAKFGESRTVEQIRNVIRNNGFKCGRKKGSLTKGKLKAFTAEQREFIEIKYKEMQINDLVPAFNLHFGTDKPLKQIRAFIKNHKILSGRDGRFGKFHDTWNKGKCGWTAGGRSSETRFKPGRDCHNRKPVGSTRLDSKCGYILIKVEEPNVWRFAQRVEWEKHYGPIPKGYIVQFKDNNRTNYEISNLFLVSRSQSVVINKLGLSKVESEFKETAIVLANISIARRQRALANKAA